jgi:Rrf2 family protein
MLTIKKETDYAIRCVYYLSLNADRIVLVDEIAKAMHIPKSFLAKILQKLSKAGIVKSFVGTRGGHSLARSSAAISLLDVIVAVEGAMAMNSCTVRKEECGLSANCVVHPVWVSVKRDVENILKMKTFALFK